jgi:hypothetical protein
MKLTVFDATKYADMRSVPHLLRIGAFRATYRVIRKAISLRRLTWR